jgi:hypothetical protein
MSDQSERVTRGGDAEAKKKVVKRFLYLIKTGERPPVSEWEEAIESYEGFEREDDRPRANLWQSRVKTQAAYLDEEPAKVRVVPPAGYADDQMAKLRADMDEELFAYLRREMGYDKAFKKMRHSADLTNVGCLVHCVDTRKLLPEIRYLPNERLAVDGECNGDLKRGGWVAYYDWVAPEIIAEQYPEISLDTLRKAAVQSERLLDPDSKMRDEEREVLENAYQATSDMRSRCKLWRVYARGEYALYDTHDYPEEKPHMERFRTREGMDEARRYLEIIEGLEEPVQDADEWPEVLALDYDEWPVTVIRYNDSLDSFWSFTDYRHEERLVSDFDRALASVARSQSLSGLKFGCGPNFTGDENMVKNRLGSTEVELLKDTFDANGNQTFKALDLGSLTPEQLQYLDVIHDLHDEMSGVPKVKRGEENEDVTATATKIASDASTAKSNVRLRKWEAAIAEAARKTLQIAHAALHKYSAVEVVEAPPIIGGIPLIGNPKPRVRDNLSWREAQVLLMQPESQLLYLGVEAMVGPMLAEAWVDGEPRDVIRRCVMVSVEKGSTQRHARMEKALLFREIYADYMNRIEGAAMGGYLLTLNEAMKKLFGMMELDEFDSVLVKPEEFQMPVQIDPQTGQPIMPAGAPNANV